MNKQDKYSNCWGYQEFEKEQREVKVEDNHQTIYYGRTKKSTLLSKKNYIMKRGIK